MTILLQDNFNRANSATLVGSPQIGPAPVIISGVGGITSNTLYAPTAIMAVVWDLGTIDVEMSVSAIGTITGRTLGLMFGVVSSTEHYLVQFDPDTMRVYRSNPGGYQPLMQAGPGTTATSTVCKASYKDGYIRVYQNGTLWMTCPTPVVPTNTRAGLRLTHASSIRVDDLLGEDSPVLPDVVETGGIVEQAYATAHSDPPFTPSSFLYRGRDSKALDIAGGA